MEFKDCEYRYTEDDILYCDNKYDKDNRCDNCKQNIHLNCTNYNPKKDFCLKFFEPEVSLMADCKEKSVFNDKELSCKEVLLYQKKTAYQQESDRIIAETNFKELYGANNQKVRDNHVKKELGTWYDTIKDLEFSIDWIGRRISFLRELIRVKRTIMESK